jgi:hypothetical protein
MSVQVAGNAGVVTDVDEARNLLTYEFIPGYPAAGGFYSVAGFTTAVIAAALAANTTLMAARFALASTRRCYLRRMRVLMSVMTAGAAGGIPTALALQRFTNATPTAGTARTVDRVSTIKGTATDMTDVRDSNAALTVGAVVFGNIIASTLVPNSSTNIGPVEWLMDFPTPEELGAGDGICLRTQNAGPATATWGYSYTLYWGER